MRIVIDSNLLVAAVISAGLPRQLVNAAKAGVFELCTSEVLLAELLDVMGRQRFAQRLAQAGLTPQSIVDDLRALSVVVSPLEVPRVVPTDPDDDHVLAAALTGAVDLIASGDKRDLLQLGSYWAFPSSLPDRRGSALKAWGSDGGTPLKPAPQRLENVC